LKKLSYFEEFAYGTSFTLADIAAALQLPGVSYIYKDLSVKDILADAPAFNAYSKGMEKSAPTDY
jgi:glutathione S-transferase